MASTGGGSSKGGGRPQLKVYNPRNKPVEPPKAYEDQIQDKAQSTSLPDIGSLSLDTKSQPVPFRPAYGKAGKSIELLANYFPLLMDPQAMFHRYSINIENADPHERNDLNEARAIVGAKRRRIIYLLIKSPWLAPIQNIDGIATDFKATLISVKEIPTKARRGPVNYTLEDSTVVSAVYNITLKHTGSFKFSDLIDSVTSTQISCSFEAKADFMQGLNIILGHRPKLLSMNGNPDRQSPVQQTPSMMSPYANRHYAISPVNGVNPESFNLGGGLTAWRGYFMSVRTAASRVLVNVQVKHAAAYDAGPLRQVLHDFARANGHDLHHLGKFLNGMRVAYSLPNLRPLPKTIFGLTHPKDGPGLGNTFGAKPGNAYFMWQQNGKSQRISVAEYFEQRYGITLGNYPIINVGNHRKPIYLPVENCTVPAGQVSMKDLTPSQTRSMITFAVRHPTLNLSSIENDGPRVLSLSQGNYTLKTFHIKLQQDLVALEGRLLPAPRLQYGNKSREPKDGQWNLSAVQFSSGASLQHWITVQISIQNETDPADLDRLDKCVQSFTKSLRSYGMRVNECSGIIDFAFDVDRKNRDRRPMSEWRHQLESGWATGFDELWSQIRTKNKGVEPVLVLFVFNESERDLYNRIKFHCDIKWGVHSVCVTAPVFIKDGSPGTYANIALKFNMKLMGTNHLLHSQHSLPIIKEGKTMVMGIDVTHPSPSSSANAPSIAAVVASIDKNLSSFPGSFSTQYHDNSGRSLEMVKNLSESVQARLRLWQRLNRELPKKILVLRDGVSEGQHDAVLNRELPQIQAACSALYGSGTKPEITVVIVSKRHHTRFYPRTEGASDRGGNPKNGTVVDRTVTETRVWDFFLQAHTALHGTARPAHFFVVYDQIFKDLKTSQMAPFRNTADLLQDMIHKMSYTYVRATKAVSIPPAVYYADRLADRARRYYAHLFEPGPGDSSHSETSSQRELDEVKVHKNLQDSMWYL